jgi:hypothetical protein
MNLKNHTTCRPWMLTGPQGDVVSVSAGGQYRWNLNNLPPVTRKMCNYLVGIIVTFFGSVTYDNEAGYLDWSDVARGLFESAEVQQTMFGTPVSANHYLGKYFGLFEFVANGMEKPVPEPPPLYGDTQGPSTKRHSWFIPVSSLLGMKGHHTAQPAVCYDRAQFILKLNGAGVVPNLTFETLGAGATIQCSAVLNPEPELRLGPGTSFIQYTQPAAASGTIVTLDGFGNSSTLEGVEQGAGIAFLAWMGTKRGFGGAQDPSTIEYLNVPFRDVQQTRHLDPFYIDYLNACGGLDGQWVNSLLPSNSGLDGGGHRHGLLYAVDDQFTGYYGLTDACFLPIISPHKFLESSKLQVVQGSQTVNMKSTGSFTGQHVFTALQYHSWTPSKQEEVLRKLVESGVAMAVWGTNDLEPKLKVTNKQDAGGINPSKSRFFPITFVPRTKVSSPPTT